MKYLVILLLALFISACSGSKKAIATQSKTTENTEAKTESLELSEPLPNKGKTQKLIEVVDSEGNTIGKVRSFEEAQELLKKNNLKKQNDSIKKAAASAKTASQEKESLHFLWDELLQKHVSNNGNVDYIGFKNSRKDLRSYIKVITNYYPKLNKLSKEEKLAYWINAYNALTVDLIVNNYPVKSIKDIEAPWGERLWKFGVKWLNLNDIEHQILRKMNEPRIHFAIVCASVSCPKLQNKAFTADKLEVQLTNATKEFLSDNSKNQLSENSVKLSKIFRWFGKDFKTKDSTIIDFLNSYSDISISEDAKKSYLYYNWDLND